MINTREQYIGLRYIANRVSSRKLKPNGTEGNFYANRIPVENGMNCEGELNFSEA